MIQQRHPKGVEGCSWKITTWKRHCLITSTCTVICIDDTVVVMFTNVHNYVIWPLHFHSQDLFGNSTYCFPYIADIFCSENFFLNFYLSWFSSLVCLTLYWYCKEKFCFLFSVTAGSKRVDTLFNKLHINTGNSMYTPEPAHHSSVRWLTLHLYQAFSKVAKVLPAKNKMKHHHKNWLWSTLSRIITCTVSAQKETITHTVSAHKFTLIKSKTTNQSVILPAWMDRLFQKHRAQENILT